MTKYDSSTGATPEPGHVEASCTNGTSPPIREADAFEVLNGCDPTDVAGNTGRLRDGGFDDPQGWAVRFRNHAAEADKEAKAAAEALRRERNTRSARLTVDREEAESAMRLPPERDDYTLASYRAEQRPPKVERVEQLQRAGHRTVLVASYKTGKTTLHANLTRSLVDGDRFLGRFKVKSPQGRVGIWNGEMDSEDYEQYLVDAGVAGETRVAIWNLRGFRVPLVSDAGADAAVNWLKANDVGYWIIDPWARVCAWSNVDEDKNSEVGPLLQRVDEIADAAEVGEVLIVHHAGHVRGRARGASVFSDWADGIWLYGRGEEGDEESRYLKAEGRGVALEEGLVELDAGRLSYREVGRRRTKLNRLAAEIVRVVGAYPEGIGTSEAQNEITGGNAAKLAAVKQALSAGLIREDKDPTDGRKKLLFPVPHEGADFS